MEDNQTTYIHSYIHLISVNDSGQVTQWYCHKLLQFVVNFDKGKKNLEDKAINFLFCCSPAFCSISVRFPLTFPFLLPCRNVPALLAVAVVGASTRHKTISVFFVWCQNEGSGYYVRTFARKSNRAPIFDWRGRIPSFLVENE